MKLAIIQNWDETFGYYDIESEFNINLNNHLNYFKKKNFVVYNWDRDEDGVEQTLSDFINLFNYLNNVCLRVPVRRRRFLPPIKKKYRLKIVKEYKYADRDFCSINTSFENFIKKCKNYYSQKLTYLKSPKSHLNRQIYGKYNFKFKNV